MLETIAYWWVNHSQTAVYELQEGYIWSPQKKKNGRSSQPYTNLTLTKIGDIIFSFADTKIKAVGKVIANCIDSQRPEEFGQTGQQWDNLGWLVQVQWDWVSKPFYPKDNLEDIVPLLPSKYSPIRENGHGNQGIYLAAISPALGKKLLSLINGTNFGITTELQEIDHEREEASQLTQIKNLHIPDTDKEQLILARRGQGKFRFNLGKVENRCRVTGLTDMSFLIASHIKPWRVSSNAERLDGHNGFLLSPHVDKLFDRGYITFNDNGSLLPSDGNVLHILQSWRIDVQVQLGSFSNKQKAYLDYHRTHIFKQ